MKKACFVCIGLISLLLSLSHNSYANEEKEPFYSQISHAVIRLEKYVSSVNNDGSIATTEIAPVGTAFFVEDTNNGRMYVVTARHVAEQKFDLHARVEVFNEKTKNYEVIMLNLPRVNWTFHPLEGDSDTFYVDVAVMKVSYPANSEVERTFRSFKYNLTDSKANQLPDKDPSPPEQVLVFGFPEDIGFQLLEQRPMGRSGIVSMYTGKKYLKISASKLAEEKCLLLDIKIKGGNSGSPVIGNPSSNLVGVLIAGDADTALIEPASRIRETLEIAKKKPIKAYQFWGLFQ